MKVGMVNPTCSPTSCHAVLEEVAGLAEALTQPICRLVYT